MAIHPTGHFFVVGHADGSLAFWAAEDDERPLLVRTLEAIDVNIVNMQTLDEHISQERPSKDAHIDREPIFKLSWSALSDSSDPRGGETTLTILGGLRTNQATGITVYLFPAFNPPNPPEPTTAADQQLHPYLRGAMRNSLNHLKSFFYYTRGTVQDYLLIPRESPHFSGTADPMAIMLLTEADGDARAVEAYQYPPPEFSSPVDVEEEEENKGVPVEALGDVLASTLRSMLISDEPKRLWLPSAVMNGSTGLLNGQLLTVETAVYQTLVDEGINDALYLPLRGGLAWADDTQKTELRLAKVRNGYTYGVSVCHFRLSAPTSSFSHHVSPQSDHPVP
jgi:syntaxin-binding protein 5